MVTARDWSCGLIDHIILKDATCKICSGVYCCEVSHDGTFLILKDVTVTDTSSSPRNAFVKSNVGDFFGINSLWENQTVILSHIMKREKSLQSYGGYGMYCQWSLLQFSSDILRENPTCVTFTILDICRSVQHVFFFVSYQCKSTPLQV